MICILLQALLSAHDTVAQKDYEPVLPPMPEELPEDEEATRIVCLVKNKQPLVSNTQAPADLKKGGYFDGITPLYNAGKSLLILLC